MERAAAQAWICRPLWSEALVPGQRDGWSLADRTYDGNRVRVESTGCGTADALCRSFAAINRVRLVRSLFAYVPRIGRRSIAVLYLARSSDVHPSLSSTTVVA